MQALGKEDIKTRMVKTAARLWNIPENEIEVSFDPLLLLLIEACAAEMEKIGFEIQHTQARLLEKCIELLVPASSLGIKPASCIAFATPVEETAAIHTDTFFDCTQNIRVKDKTTAHHFYFTPVGKFTLHKATPAYFFMGRKIFKIKPNGTKELLYSSDKSNTTVRQVHLALDTPLISLDGMQIYFELHNHPAPEKFYHSLQHAALLLPDNTTVAAGHGYYHSEQFDYAPDEILANGISHVDKINKSVAAIYAGQFIHIPANSNVLHKTPPPGITHGFPQSILDKIQANNYAFLSLELNRNFTEEELEGINCFINAFPVINKQKHALTYITDKWVNIVPLPTQGHFLDLLDVSTVGGKAYQHRVAPVNGELKEGQAVVRNSGVRKADAPFIRNMIGSMIHAIQNESNFFTEFNNEFILSKLKEISQLLARIDDQLVKSGDMKTGGVHLLLKPQTPGETVTIQYVATDAELANQLAPYTGLAPHNHLLTGIKDNYIVSKPLGGKSNFSFAEKETLLKQQIFSKDKIVSTQDIKLLFRQLFSNSLVQIEIKKGYAIGTAFNQGLHKTIDILLTLGNISWEEANYLKNEALDVLNQKATLVYPFRVELRFAKENQEP